MIFKTSIILIYFYITLASASFCYWNSGCPYKYFSSKTPYTTVRGDIRDSIINIKGCEPISIWGLIRHGKSNPEDIFAENIEAAIRIKNHVVTSYDNGSSSLCAQDIENLRKWTLNKKIIQEPTFLTAEGYQEMEGIGDRFRRAFSQLLTDLQNGSYVFHPGPEKKMEDSAKAFISGLRNERLVVNKTNNYGVIAPFTACEEIQEDYLKTQVLPKVNGQLTKYQSTPDYLAAKDRMQRRLGIDYPLLDQEIESLYDLCRYTWSGIDNKFSPWCALFTTEDLRVLEYTGDLEHYYKGGYGTPINEVLGKIPIADLFSKFQDAKNGKGHKITAYFMNSNILNMACTFLNLYKDESPLTGAHRDPKRKWRTSIMSAFSANLVAVLNRCTKNSEEDYNVVFYWNEEPMRSICEHGVCSWQEFVNKFRLSSAATADFCGIKYSRSS